MTIIHSLSISGPYSQFHNNVDPRRSKGISKTIENIYAHSNLSLSHLIKIKYKINV